MKVFFSFALILAVVNAANGADVVDLDTALQNTYYACVDIDQDLNDMKKMAGINTAVSGVATGLGVGATVAGFSKAKVDKKIEKWEMELNQMIQNQNNQSGDKQIYQTVNISSADLRAALVKNTSKDVNDIKNSIKDAENKSKKLGNWRTGLLAGNATTNIVGAIMANKNKVDSDLQNRVDNCAKNLRVLKNTIIQARIEGADVSEAQNIYNECADYEYIDLSPITKRAVGATISSAVGAVTAGIGVATSIAANSDNVRQNDKDKEKKLNNASNALSVGSSIASASATVFNAAQIAAIKKIVKVSEQCTKVLK